MKILTNHGGQSSSPTWEKFTTFIPPAGNGWLASLMLAVKMYRRRGSYDCVVLGAGRSDFMFAVMQSLLPFRRVPCVMIDCLWYRQPSRARFMLGKFMKKLAGRGVDAFMVWSSREIEAYSGTFGIPRSKFVFVPYHTTADPGVAASEGDYIFSGGNFGRDYPTLIEAVRGLPVKVFIASTRPELFAGLQISENVDVRGYSGRGFREKMAGCRISVVALDARLLHSGGQQTFLNSMWYGKPTIVTDPEGAADYIRHGDDGLLVPCGDRAALRQAILTLLEDPEAARRMGLRAREKAEDYSTEEHFKKIVSMVRELLERKKKHSGRH